MRDTVSKTGVCDTGVQNTVSKAGMHDTVSKTGVHETGVQITAQDRLITAVQHLPKAQHLKAIGILPVQGPGTQGCLSLEVLIQYLAHSSCRDVSRARNSQRLDES